MGTSHSRISKILIANRGEIAVRIIRTCRDLGIKTVAVYSEADRASFHVQLADEAYPIGPPSAAESYLSIPKIIEAAKKSGATAVHPGYGFLSEKAPFSKACLDSGLIFLGPSPDAIEKMGDKVEARKIAEAAKVPMVPGLLKPLRDAAEAIKLAGEMGYPVLLKAAAGGGGKGMRVVTKESEVKAAFERASSEATKAFGDGRLYIEKYLESARHVEVQILCDSHGNGVHLFERECSLQRRHQKIIEEAPCAFISETTREMMTTAALRLVANVAYEGVGTVEFLVDAKQNFYFLEMNTRLQVEHPVTEAITGFDLVEQQIRVGEGEKLSLKQEDIVARGAAIECRLYAEDPDNNFFPSPGTIEWMTVPEGPWVRHDAGVYEGAEIPIYYDPIIAKLITWGSTRDCAIRRMQRALREYEIGGFKTNIPFLRTLVSHPDFLSGKIHTRYIDDHPELAKKKPLDLPLEVIFGVAAMDKVSGGSPSSSGVKTPVGGTPGEAVSPWKKQGLRDLLNQRY